MAGTGLETFDLDGVAGDDIGLFIGVAQLNAPFLGGTLVPQPILTVLIPTGAAGNIVINDTIPGGISGGVSIYIHMWAADVGGPFGACATNALELITP